MESTDKLYAWVWAAAGITICVVSLIISITYTNSYNALTEMVKNGANPIDAACALDSLPERNKEICTLRAVNKNLYTGP